MPSEFKNSLLSQLESGLRRLESKSQRRSLLRVAGVNLCSNDYLGLSQNEGLRAAILEAVQRAENVGGTGSRLLSGHFAVWEELENEFTGFAGTEAALYFSSGYAANLGLLTSLLGKDDLVFSDELNHASIIDGVRLSGARKVIYSHLDLNALEGELKRHEAERCRKIIVSESVFSMDGDVADISAMVAMAERFGASVVLDEAHATAVHGPSGRGIAVAGGKNRSVLAIVHTCGKALASAGAFVCGSGVLKEHLINHARTFIFSTAMPPYMAAQISAALYLASGMDAERRSLLDAARQFSGALQNAGWETSSTSSQIVPAIVGSNRDALGVAEFLQSEGFAVRAIRPPTVPEGKSRLRFSLTSLIKHDELDRLLSSLNEWRERREIHAAAVRA
ncbi:MAG TPA: 8-amino-7-oxononanoate synthase [Candidatus Dormibacteraeota bacterium]|jgi:8-amino-7-oxononanoate synthase|nr:8-amino-7-oxononanoate synthase [Candidatus Dormibacteraeota bacterium]